jgi:hypothetical protein
MDGTRHHPATPRRVVRVRGFHRPVSRPVRGKETGASPILGGVAEPKMMIADEALVQGSSDGGVDHLDDHSGGGSGRERSAARPRTPR